MVITRYGIVATSHVQASQAGAQVLARGGSAADAAIAANAVLGVTEPMMNGIGGDLFAIFWEAKTGKLYGLNASGWAPQGLTPEHLKAKGATSMPHSGIDTVTVPGAVAGWSKLHERFGRLPWKDLFRPAIFYAQEGYPVPELIQTFWDDAPEVFAQDAEGRRVFLPNGKTPAVGEIFQNHDLAKALRLIAGNGASDFYRGEIAGAILRTSQALGGTMSADDLAQFLPQWVEPISTGYRGWKVYELPPNGQGMAVLEMLNIMETLPLTAHQRRERLEELIEDLGLQQVRRGYGYLLSGGERRRVEVARSLVISPSFMLLDEPFSGIDPLAVEDIQRIILQLKSAGIGVLLTDHNVRETLQVTDRAYIVSKGRVFRAGTPEELGNDAEVKKIYLGDNFRLAI